MDALNEKTKLVNGTILVSSEQYHAIDGLVLVESELVEFRNNNYALPTKREEVWEFFARGNTNLTQKYKTDVCDSLNLTFNSVMGLYMPMTFTKGMRFLCVGSVDDNDRSDAYGNYNLVYNCGRLVGVAPEAPVLISACEAPRENGAVPDLEKLL
ncbi:hypothetical protein HZA96_02625 [Candidatus Woesearchaeota archaeon]|nr:hypothetical protein [Candidatus Woesearchaeota archaeon]